MASLDANGRKSSEIFMSPDKLVCSVSMNPPEGRFSVVKTMLATSVPHLATSAPRWGVPKKTWHDVGERG